MDHLSSDVVLVQRHILFLVLIFFILLFSLASVIDDGGAQHIMWGNPPPIRLVFELS